MTADNPYAKSEINSIPISNLKEIIEDEITSLLFDFGQKVGSRDPEFEYLVKRTTEVLRYHYPTWRLNYLDECFRKGKLDEYDKGQRVTMKRLEYWLKSYNISLMDRIKVKPYEKVYSEEDNKRFVNNSLIYGPAMRFRQARKPEFDAEKWTLAEIIKTPAFLTWMKLGAKSPQSTENLIFTKIY